MGAGDSRRIAWGIDIGSRTTSSKEVAIMYYEGDGPWWEAIVFLMAAIVGGILVGMWIVAELERWQ